MLPYLKNRIISVVRAPDGVDGDIFFKKHLENEREGVNKIELKNKNNKKDDYYFISNFKDYFVMFLLLNLKNLKTKKHRRLPVFLF